jgi:hypothetical protein
VQCANGLDAARNWQRGPGDLSLGRMAVPSAMQRPHTPTEQRDWHALTAAVRPRYLPWAIKLIKADPGGGRGGDGGRWKGLG